MRATFPETAHLVLPFVIVNLAMTADGKIATANQTVSSFGSRHDQRHLLKLRSTTDAVMAGARTVDLNSVTLGPGPAAFRRLRRRAGLAEYNLRVIVSGSASINPEAEIFRHRFSPIIILTTDRAPIARVKRLCALADEVKPIGESQVDFSQALRWLHEKWRVKRLLCEGGGELNGALLAARLVDELHLTVCPKIFGGRGAPTIADGVGIDRLAEAKQLRLMSAEQIGEELFLVYVTKARLRTLGFNQAKAGESEQLVAQRAQPGRIIIRQPD